jgi:hypothetical protein
LTTIPFVAKIWIHVLQQVSAPTSVDYHLK